MEALLHGANADWHIDDESVRIQFGRGLLVPRLHKALGMVVVPFEAISGVTVSKGWQGKAVLRLLLRSGADPLLAAAGGQLKEREDPYRLVLPAGREGVAEYHAEELRLRVGLAELGDRPAGRFLLQGPSVPRQVKGHDGDGYFDGTTVTLNWNWSAKSSKRKAGSQRFDIAQIEGVEWSPAGPRKPDRTRAVRVLRHTRAVPPGTRTRPEPHRPAARAGGGPGQRGRRGGVTRRR